MFPSWFVGLIGRAGSPPRLQARITRQRVETFVPRCGLSGENMPVMRDRTERPEQPGAHPDHGRAVPAAQDRCAAASAEIARFARRGTEFAKQPATIVDLTGRRSDGDDCNERRSGGFPALCAVTVHERTQGFSEMHANGTACAMSRMVFHARALIIAKDRVMAAAGLIAS